MAERFWVRLEKTDMVFSAAHFITFNGNVCERLHGHNYRVAVEYEGALDENHYVVDFIALRDTLQAIVTELDHHTLLPTQHEQIRVQANEREVEATCGEKRWLFPREDCQLLPVANTTAELLAQYIAQRLLTGMQTQQRATPPRLRISVDENQGQWGCYEITE